MRVTVWSDIGCPWATLALHSLREAADQASVYVEIDHYAFPLELFNSRPTPRAILDAEIVAIAGVVPELQWTMWAADSSSYPVAMLPALEAVQAAKLPEVGGLPASQELDWALRRAFYVESRCISMHSVVMDVARQCRMVDVAALQQALSRGEGRARVFDDWETANANKIQGSPTLITRLGVHHNPGADYHWTAPPGRGMPRLDRYDTTWATALVQGNLQ